MITEVEYLDYIDKQGYKAFYDLKSCFLVVNKYFEKREFTYENCLGFKRFLLNQGKAPSYVNSFVKVIKQICQYYKIKRIPYDDLINELPYEKITTIKEKEVLSEYEIKKLAFCKLQFFSGEHPFKLKNNNKTNLRYTVAILLLSYGLRIDEVITLQWDTVYANRVKVKGKTGERIASIPPKLFTIMSQLDRNKYVVGSGKGKMLEMKLNEIIREKAKKIGITRYLTSHCFRHSYIHNNIVAGENITFIGEQVGHKNWSTTQKYTHLTYDNTQKLVQSYKVLRDEGIDTEKDRLIAKILRTNDKNKLKALSTLI